jgi:hypothetical protein
MAVVIQQMVKADISGVLFTVDPVTGNRNEGHSPLLFDKHQSGLVSLCGKEDRNKSGSMRLPDLFLRKLKFRLCKKRNILDCRILMGTHFLHDIYHIYLCFYSLPTYSAMDYLITILQKTKCLGTSNDEVLRNTKLPRCCK